VATEVTVVSMEKGLPMAAVGWRSVRPGSVIGWQTFRLAVPQIWVTANSYSAAIVPSLRGISAFS
jgi:hypothetical protein